MTIMMSTAPRVLLFLIALTIPSMAQTRISGTVLGSDGRPMSAAHLHLMTDSGPTVTGIANDGTFATTVGRLGAIRLYFTGADHQPHSIYLYLERPDTVTLDLRLAAHQFESTFGQVAVVGSFNRFDWNSSRSMTRDGDGEWSVEIPAPGDSLEYQLLNVARDRSVNGTMSERLRYDGGGDYISVVPVVKGKAHIRFDPKLLRSGSTVASLIVSEAAPATRASIAAYEQFRVEVAARRAAIAVVDEMPDDSARMFIENWLRSANEELAARLSSVRDPWSRQLVYAAQYDLTPTLWRHMRMGIGPGIEMSNHPLPGAFLPEVIPPTSPLWIESPQAVAHASFDNRMDSSGIVAYLEKVATLHPDADVRSGVAFIMLNSVSEILSPEQLRLFYTVLEKDDASGERLSMVRIVHGADPNFLHAERITPYSTITGRVIDVDGTVVANAAVVVESNLGSVESIENAETGSDSTFSLPLIRAGFIRLEIYKKENEGRRIHHIAELYVDRPVAEQIIIRLTDEPQPSRSHDKAFLATIDFADPKTPFATIAREVAQALDRWREWNLSRRIRLQPAAGGSEESAKAKSLAMREALWSRLQETRDSLVRRVRLVEYLNFVGRAKSEIRPGQKPEPGDSVWVIRDSLAVREMLFTVPPTSWLWRMEEALPLFMMNVAGTQSSSPEFIDYMEQLVRDHPDAYLTGETLFALASNTRYDTVKYPRLIPQARFACRALDMLLARPDGDEWGDRARLRLAPTRPLQKGSAVPTFAFRSIDNDSVVYTPATMSGKYYLIDFWATWCGPCLGEMEPLHDAYRKYRKRGFEILSVSFDGSPSAVGIYRRGDWKMPWLHTFADGGFGSAAAQAFGVGYLPRTVMVGPDGKILAFDLRGEDLGAFLDRALK